MRRSLLVAAIALGAALVLACRAVFLALGSALYMYLLPGIVAQRRGHPHQRRIYRVTALIGWLVVPWILMLLYALLGERSDAICVDQPVVVGFVDD